MLSAPGRRPSACIAVFRGLRGAVPTVITSSQPPGEWCPASGAPLRVAPKAGGAPKSVIPAPAPYRTERVSRCHIPRLFQLARESALRRQWVRPQSSARLWVRPRLTSPGPLTSVSCSASSVSPCAPTTHHGTTTTGLTVPAEHGSPHSSRGRRDGQGTPRVACHPGCRPWRPHPCAVQSPSAGDTGL